MDPKCPNLVCSGHMTWYNLITFVGTFKKDLMIVNLEHHSHMTWYILNIPDNIPSWDVVVTSVWYILNVLNMCQFGMVLVLRSKPYNVSRMG